jgi:hypothetical protein
MLARHCCTANGPIINKCVQHLRSVKRQIHPESCGDSSVGSGLVRAFETFSAIRVNIDGLGFQFFNPYLLVCQSIAKYSDAPQLAIAKLPFSPPGLSFIRNTRTPAMIANAIELIQIKS